MEDSKPNGTGSSDSEIKLNSVLCQNKEKHRSPGSWRMWVLVYSVASSLKVSGVAAYHTPHRAHRCEAVGSYWRTPAPPLGLLHVHIDAHLKTQTDHLGVIEYISRKHWEVFAAMSGSVSVRTILCRSRHVLLWRSTLNTDYQLNLTE